MRQKLWSITALVGAVVSSASVLGLASCGGSKPDFAKNEGAVAWLAYHHGTIPRACISALVEKYGVSSEIDETARRKAEADAMQIAGETYAISMASERLIVERERMLQLKKEGFAQGYVTESGVIEAVTKLNEAISDWRISRYKLAGLDACEFTATDETFGFKTRWEISYYSAVN